MSELPSLLRNIGGLLKDLGKVAASQVVIEAATEIANLHYNADCARLDSRWRVWRDGPPSVPGDYRVKTPSRIWRVENYSAEVYSDQFKRDWAMFCREWKIAGPIPEPIEK